MSFGDGNMAKGKAKKIIFWCVIGYLAVVFSVLGLVFLNMWAPWLKGPAIEYYSDDAHYFRTAGLVKV